VFRDSGTAFVTDVPMLNPTTFAYDALARAKARTSRIRPPSMRRRTATRL
jgi:hypothetical protein